ncbi:hypothetical protein HDU93_003510 [Gonapodya sp. JEL0774]|nr:hypothetical protein HDU93_003510 [Gonapodya sp. JEL0774]
MFRRSQGITGSNTLPLGKPRRAFNTDQPPPPDDEYGTPPPPPPSGGYEHGGYQQPPPPPPPIDGYYNGSDTASREGTPVIERKRPRDDGSDRGTPEPDSGRKAEPQATARGRAPHRKKNRWGDPEVKVNIPGLPTALPGGMSAEQAEMYAIHLRLEEIGRKLRTGEVVPPESERSPSPPPTYGADGKRSNTREVRYKKKYEDERHKLVERASKLDPSWRPPADYKKPTKMQDKVWIPAREFPEINFIGLLIGPRGNTLKKLEADTGAKVSIRGKGSVKEGRSRADGGLAPGEEEELHCLITADSEEKVAKAVKLIEKTIETAASVPEGQNELKRLQLRQLAELNGTLRDDENQICQNCGGIGHRKYDCPETKNVTINLICRICNNAGHIARDCMHKDDPAFQQEAREREKELDSEYSKFMTELSGPGTGGAGGSGGTSKPSLPWANQGGSALPWKQAAGPAVGGMAPPTFGIEAPPPGMSAPGMPPGMPGYWGSAPAMPPPPGMGVPGGYGASWGAPPPPPPSFQVEFP